MEIEGYEYLIFSNYPTPTKLSHKRFFEHIYLHRQYMTTVNCKYDQKFFSFGLVEDG